MVTVIIRIKVSVSVCVCVCMLDHTRVLWKVPSHAMLNGQAMTKADSQLSLGWE